MYVEFDVNLYLRRKFLSLVFILNLQQKLICESPFDALNLDGIRRTNRVCHRPWSTMGTLVSQNAVGPPPASVHNRNSSCSNGREASAGVYASFTRSRADPDVPQSVSNTMLSNASIVLYSERREMGNRYRESRMSLNGSIT